MTNSSGKITSNITKIPLNKFEINAALRETIRFETNLSDEAKRLFVQLCDDPGKITLSQANAFVELIKRNYVWIQGFPANVPVAGRDRSRSAIRRRGLKQFIFGVEQ